MLFIVALLGALVLCLAGGLVIAFRWRRRVEPGGPPTDDQVERRSSTRVHSSPFPVIVRSAAKQGPALHALVLDRSEGGLRLRMGQIFAAGSVLRICGILDGESGPSVKVRVRTCLRCGQSWDVGCQFVRRPSPAELQVLDGRPEP